MTQVQVFKSDKSPLIVLNHLAITREMITDANLMSITRKLDSLTYNLGIVFPI